jgi:hypothetical protein
MHANSETFQEGLVVSISFPDVKGALTPTVAAAFIDAVSALRKAEKSASNHKSIAISQVSPYNLRIAV